ncbi:cxxc_20_cxxc protein [Bacillus sp. 71mf]|nr:cxxc_20_cxxc protein [Bacillus sp. 71mf]SFS36836.1 cxxc_20_cxxc protein [Bacillus sp. 103mf]
MKTCPKCHSEIKKRTLFLRNNTHKLVCPNCDTTLHATKKSFLIYVLFHLLTCLLIFISPMTNTFLILAIWILISTFIIQPVAFFYEET